MVAALGGPSDFVDAPERYLPRAAVQLAVGASADGYVHAIRTRDIGLAVVVLGGGRTRPQDAVDHAVGVTRLLPVGHEVRRGEPLALVHAQSEDQARQAAARILAAYDISDRRPARQKAVLRRVAPQF
jgi:thymidine phosphorylase